MVSKSKLFRGGYIILVFSWCFLLSCSKDSLKDVVPEVIEEEMVEEDPGALQEGAENTVTVMGITYSLSEGTFEDWGLEYVGSRQFSIDLYSENYDAFAGVGVSFGVYLNSPSLTSFTYGTYNFTDEETTPGGVMTAGISFNRSGFHLVTGWISVEQEGENYRIKWEMFNTPVETQQEKVSGHYFGPLSYWSIDD